MIRSSASIQISAYLRVVPGLMLLDSLLYGTLYEAYHILASVAGTEVGHINATSKSDLLCPVINLGHRTEPRFFDRADDHWARLADRAHSVLLS